MENIAKQKWRIWPLHLKKRFDSDSVSISDSDSREKEEDFEIETSASFRLHGNQVWQPVNPAIKTKKYTNEMQDATMTWEGLAIENEVFRRIFLKHQLLTIIRSNGRSWVGVNAAQGPALDLKTFLITNK